jgi:hypothetical protein
MLRTQVKRAQAADNEMPLSLFLYRYVTGLPGVDPQSVLVRHTIETVVHSGRLGLEIK